MCNLTQGSVLSTKWVAMCMTASDLDKHLLPSEEAAWDYIYDRMCVHCKQERARALASKDDGTPVNDEWGTFDSEHPGCACEWDVITEEDYASIYSGDIK
jgi:hypothetical protein